MLVERRLREHGVEALVDNDARLFDLIHEGSRRYRAAGFARFPDVLAIQYGTVEMQPNVVPTRVSRHLTRGGVPGGGLAGRWRRHVVPRIWPPVRRWQQWASPRVGERSWRVPPARFAAELRRLIEVGREAGSVVVVLDVHRPGSTYRHFFPGIDERWEILQRTIHDVVASFGDDDVSLLPAADIAGGFGDDHLPDGMHWTPPVHRAVADALVDLVGPDLGASCP